MKIGGGASQRKTVLTALLLILIVVVAVFFRFSGLDYAPPALYPDEAVNGINAIEAHKSGDFSVFYTENNGREGLFANAAGVLFGVFGMSPQTLRATAGIFGVLMVIGLFFLTKLLWGRRIALIASYLSAVGFWAVNFSRIGFRGIILPAVLVWSFYFLFKGIQQKSTGWIALSGLVFGVGLHSYISFRIAPVLLLLLLVVLFYKRPTLKPKLWKWAGVFAVAALLTASPLLLYWVDNPGDFLGRAGQVSVFNAENPLVLFGETAVKTLGMFSFVGDFNWRHNIGGRPLLGYGVGLAFLIGAAYLIVSFARKRRVRDWFLLLWFIIMLTPNFFAPEGAPHALRALGALPAVYIIAALGLERFYTYIQHWLEKKKERFSNNKQHIDRIQKEVAVLGILLLLFAGVWEARAYFVQWAPRAETATAFESELSYTATFLQTTRTEEKFVIENSGGVAVQTIVFLTWQEKDEIQFIHEDAVNTLPVDLEDAVVVLVHKDAELLQNIAERYPAAQKIKQFNGLRIP